MTEYLRRLYAQRATAWDSMQGIRREVESVDRDLSAEERAAWDRAEADITRLSADIEREERAMRMAQVPGVNEHAGAPAGDPAGDPDQLYRAAFGSWVRRGMEGVPVESREALAANFRQEERALAAGSGTTTAGGYLVPTGFLSTMTETMKAYGGILRHASVLETDTGNDIPWPKVDDTSNVGAILDENTQITEQDVAFGQTTIKAHTYTSKLIRVSLVFLQDVAIDAESFLARTCGTRIGRALAGHLATGTGSGQPTGIAGSAGFATGKTGASGQTTSIILDDLFDLEHSIDPAYRQSGSCKFVLADSSLKVIRKLKDADGRPIWEPSLTAGAPSRILGYEVVVDNGMPAMAASAKSVAFGDLKAGLLVRQVRGAQLMRLTERYADYLQVGFFGFSRWDAKIDDAAAVRLYVNAAA